MDIDLDQLTRDYNLSTGSGSRQLGNGTSDPMSDLALSPNSYEALTTLLQGMSDVDPTGQHNHGNGNGNGSVNDLNSALELSMQLPMSMQMPMLGLPNFPFPNPLQFPFNLEPTYGEQGYAGINNGTTDPNVRPSDILGTEALEDPVKPWFLKKPALSLLGDGTNYFERFDPVDPDMVGKDMTSLAPSGFELVMDTSQPLADDMPSDSTRMASEYESNGSRNDKMDPFRLPTTFRPTSDPTSGSASGSGSGSGSGSAVPSPGSIINLSPGGFDMGPSAMTMVPASDDIPAIFRERLLGSFMKQGRRFGLIYHWPTFWERMRGEESLRPHPCWINAMASVCLSRFGYSYRDELT